MLKVRGYLRNGLPTHSQAAVNRHSLLVGPADPTGHQTLAGGYHSQVESGDLQHRNGNDHQPVHLPLAGELGDVLVEDVPLREPVKIEKKKVWNFQSLSGFKFF